LIAPWIFSKSACTLSERGFGLALLKAFSRWASAARAWQSFVNSAKRWSAAALFTASSN
jgi:hypothetical protein